MSSLLSPALDLELLDAATRLKVVGRAGIEEVVVHVGGDHEDLLQETDEQRPTLNKQLIHKQDELAASTKDAAIYNEARFEALSQQQKNIRSLEDDTEADAAY